MSSLRRKGMVKDLFGCPFSKDVASEMGQIELVC